MNHPLQLLHFPCNFTCRGRTLSIMFIYHAGTYGDGGMSNKDHPMAIGSGRRSYGEPMRVMSPGKSGATR